jgi:type VI protein secretion system component Hcp
MANDVYVKFGSDPDPEYGGPLKTEIPDIEGDSSDAHHWWWCELRECGFDMDTPQQEDDANQSDANKPASGFKPVTLRKRVDWASTQLFLKCCESAMATTTKSTEDKGKGKINDVTVEVCRPAGGEKVPCLRVIYYGVRITRYAISITEPEPAENITFEFDKLKFKYYQTDPATGQVINSAGIETEELENHPPQPIGSAQAAGGSTGSSGAEGTTPAGGGAGGVSPTPALGLAAAASGGVPSSPGAAPDPTVNVNFPGLWQGTGFGILPD